MRYRVISRRVRMLKSVGGWLNNTEEYARLVRALTAGLAACLVVATLADHQLIVDSEAGPYSFRMTTNVLAAEQGNTHAPKPAADFRDCARCPAMVAIPAGRFTMGSPEDDPDARANEHPRHEVAITVPIAVSKFETTFDEWDACFAAGACPQAPDHWGRGQMPAINVSWNDAKQYAAWLSRVTGQRYRLLTEAEWEYAARGGGATRYSWAIVPAKVKPIATAAEANGIFDKPPPRAHSNQTRSGSTTCRATSGSGSKTLGMTTMLVPPTTDRHGHQATRTIELSAAVHGATKRQSSGPPSATSATSTSGLTPLASG